MQRFMPISGIMPLRINVTPAYQCHNQTPHGNALARYCQVNLLKLIESPHEHIQTTSISTPGQPPDIISYAVWLYYRFNFSHRGIEDLQAERGNTVSREAVRLWCIKFGTLYARRLKRKHRGYGDTFFIDEVFVKINGKQNGVERLLET
jgi:hypothetical protein